MINIKLLASIVIVVSFFVSCSSEPQFNTNINNNTINSGGSANKNTGGTDSKSTGGGINNIIVPPIGGSSNNNTGGSTVCASVDVTFEKQIPTVVLLIDRSGSMWETDFDPSRWDAVRLALFGTDGVVKSLEGDVQFGLALYNSENGDAGPECPIMKTTIPELNSFNSASAEFDAWSPREDTPTGDSIEWIISDYNFGEVLGPKIIILATDGEPDTCEVPDPNDPIRNPAGRQESNAAVSNAYHAGIETFVISVGPDVAVDHLQDLANLGRGKAIDTVEDEPVYLATSSQDLTNAFGEIINGVRSCSIELDGEISSGFEDKGVVTIDGNNIVKDDPNGYINPDMKTIEFVGTSCDLIKSGDRNIQVEFPCGGFVIITR